MSLSADSCLTALVFASDMLGTGVFAFQNDLKHIQFRDFLCIFRFYVGIASCTAFNCSFLLQEIPSNSDSMSKNKQDTENLNSGGNTIDDSKKLKWISFIGENKRNALMELIQNASSPLLRRIEQPILLNIYENEIPSHVINIPKKLFLIYFLVLDPGYLKVECVARKKLELNGKKYDSGSHISLKDNYGEHQLMLAKVGKTSLTLAVRSRSDTKIKVSVKYGSSIPLELRINKNISNHELMHKIADEAIEEMFLRPNEITRNIVRYLRCGKVNSFNQPFRLQYFIVKMNSYDDYESDASDIEVNLRKNLSFSGSNIKKDWIRNLFHETAKIKIIDSLGPTEWIVTSTSIINSLDPSGIERGLYQLSTVPDFEDSVLRFRRKFQSDYHDKKLIILRLHYKQWMYPDATTKITENTKHEPSSWKKSGIADNDATWSSAYTTVLCRAYYGPYTDEYGQEWFGGWIQMKIFAQQCLNCDEYATGELDDQKC
ncbi:unnamed protein product [Rotaria socialis]